jgi:hypothetical protein
MVRRAALHHGWINEGFSPGRHPGDAFPAGSGVTSDRPSQGREVAMPDYFTLLRDRVTLNCRSIDRIFLQAYVSKLHSVGQVCTFLRWRRQFKIPSLAAFGKIGEAYVKAVHDFVKAHQIPVVHFQKGQNKEKFARPFLQAAA